jgi:hypothetical protein
MASASPVQYLSTSDDPDDYKADPVATMTSYSKLMHLYTKKQMDAAKRASRRRNDDSTADAQSTLTKEASIDSSSSSPVWRMSF